MLDERSAAMLDHAELTKVLDDPAAMDHDPLVVRRLKRLRLRARKARLDGSSAAAGEGAHA